jgi:hypothetical protein
MDGTKGRREMVIIELNPKVARSAEGREAEKKRQDISL